jgi:heme exporter protein D
LELGRTREKCVPSQSGVVGVTFAKVLSVTVGVCIAVSFNTETARKVWTAAGITTDCLVLHFLLQRKTPRRDVVRILQREKETLQTRIGLESYPKVVIEFY